jgi:hypothetical protein
MKPTKSTISIFETTKIKKQGIMKTKTNFKKVSFAILLFIGIAMKSALAQTPLFSQNFNSSSTLSTYISSSPSNGQFNAITATGGPTATITGNALQFVRSGNGTASFVRTTNFSPVPQGIVYKFDLTVSTSSSTNSVARWQVGDGFSTSNSTQSDNDCYAQFAIDFRGSNSYRINDITNNNTSANITGTVKTVTWVLNRSGNTLSYNAPDGTVKTVANDRTDLWVGTTRYINGQNVEDNANIEDFKFVLSGSSGTITMDNFSITQYIPIVTTQPAGAITACTGTSVQFTAAASGLPTPTVKWQKFISSIWTDIPGATSNTYTIPSPVLGDAGQFRALYINSESPIGIASNTSTLTVNPASVGGSVTSNATVCSSTNSGTLTLSGHTGIVTKWQSSTNGGGSWSDIANTSASMSYLNLTQTTMYRAVVQSASCPTANSSAATITVIATTSITTQPISTSACEGANATISLVAAGGSLNYQWQDNSSGSFAAILGEVAPSLNLNAVTAGMNGRQYQCLVSGSCGNATSNIVTLTVTAPSVGGLVSGDATVCSGTNSGTLTLSSHTGNVTKWQSSANGGGSWSDITSTSTTRNYTNLTQTTLFRAVVQLNSCPIANSTPATITVNPLPTTFSVNGGGAFCAGGSGVPVGLSGSQIGVDYQLKIGGVDIGLPLSGSGASLSFGNQTSLGVYSVSATNVATTCTSLMTGSVSLINANPPAAPLVTPTNATILPGDIQAINAQAQSFSSTLGTGNSTNNSFSFPASLGTAYGGARHQILILASELTAQGILPGNLINRLSFYVSNTNSASAMTNYTISFGKTAQTSLSSTFVSGLSQVYHTSSYTAVTGINNFNFSTPFEWDGISNIIIETVFNNNNSGGFLTNCSVRYTTSAFTSVNYSRANNAGAGNAAVLALSSNGTSNRRPNMVFGHTATTAIEWSPIVELYLDAAATIPYISGNATTVYAKPLTSETYLAHPKGQGGCPSAANASSVITVITTPPNCVSATVSGEVCITSTSLSWPVATNYPAGYNVYFGTDNPPTNILYQQDAGAATSFNLPALNGATTYYYQIAPYNVNGENSACAVGSFVSGISQTQTPTQSHSSYTETMDNGVVAPALPCGMTGSDENFPQDAYTWYTSTIEPHNGSRHLRIDRNTDNITAKDDWFYSAPMNLTAGKLYRIYFWSRVSSASHTETMELFLSNAPDAATMLTTAAIYNGINNDLVHRLDSSVDIIPALSGIYYYGFHANSPANRSSLYVDDIHVREIPVTALHTLSCTTIPSMADQLLCNTVYGAQDYKYKIENLSSSFSYEYTRNLPIPDFRLIWAPGVLYGETYDVSVAYKKNNVWSPYGASCPITIGPFPTTQVRPGICGTAITTQNLQFFCDSIPGANDYEYRIVNTTLGYDHTWSRGNSLTDYRLSWAYQSAPVLVQNLPYGYTYDVQVRALVGKTGPAYGNLPGQLGTFGSVCTITLAGSPQTQLKPGSCGITLSNLTDPVFCIPVSGATDYEYHIENTALSYSRNAIRNSANTDFRFSWLANNLSQGLRFGTTYDVSVRAKVGGVWLNFGTLCQVTTPPQPQTQLQTAYCNFTLPTFQTTVYSDAIAGVTNYRYHISGPNGYDRVIDRNAPSNDFKFGWTLLCCGQQNMLPNTSYQVEVATYAGGVWSAYGPSCVITTGASVPRYSLLEDVKPENNLSAELNLSVYPNPAATNSLFSIEVTTLAETNENILVRVLDILGKVVYSESTKINSDNRVFLQPEFNLAAGVYTIEARMNSSVLRQKLVIE